MKQILKKLLNFVEKQHIDVILGALLLFIFFSIPIILIALIIILMTFFGELTSFVS